MTLFQLTVGVLTDSGTRLAVASNIPLIFFKIILFIIIFIVIIMFKIVI